MTDQRPIDPSTLRDGDIVRAKRGEHGVVEGVFCRTERGGWCLHDGPTSARETAWSAGGWTITDILRPVLVKGDRVEVAGITGEVFAEPGGFLMVLWPDESTSAVPDVISRATRLPVAPEPAPIKVGDWLESLMDKDPHVVASVDGDWIGIRWWQSGDIYRVNRQSIEGWTRLDGPPEPLQGTVYVIGKTVWHADDWGHIAAAAGAVALEWSTVCGLYDTERLATLQIVHTLGVE